MTELAALNIRITGDSGDLKAAVSQATTELQKVQDTAQRANTAVGTAGLGGGMGRLGKASNMLKGNVQNASFQLQDMVVQLQMGTRWTTVMAQQLPQLAGGFGAVGAAVGVLAAVGFSALGVAMASTGEQAAAFEDQLERLTNVTDQLRSAQDILAMTLPELYAQYGLYAAAVRDAAAALVELNIAEAQAALNSAIIDGAEALEVFTGRTAGLLSAGERTAETLSRLTREFGLTWEQAQELTASARELQTALTFDQRLAALQRMQNILDDAGVSAAQLPPELRAAFIQANQLTIAAAELTREVQTGASAMSALRASAPGGGWLASAIGQASTLASTLWDAAAAVAAAGGGQGDATGGNFPVGSRGRSRPRAAPSGIGGVDWGTAPKTGGGGGGGGEDPLVAELEALQASLMSQEEAQLESYMRQQETLKSALEQRLITQQEYNALMEQAQSQHGQAMADIDAYRYGDAALQAQTFMGDMASAFQSGNERMQKAARGFAAVEALINAWRAYTQTLADPSLPFFAKFAAAAKVLAAGMGAVNAIRGGGRGGGAASGAGAAGASASAASPAAAAQGPLQVSLNTFGAGDFIRAADFGMILDRLNAEAGDRGYTILRPA